MPILLVLTMIVFASACAARAERWQIPNQQEALRRVWQGFFGMAMAPPELWWKAGAELDCHDGHGFLQPHLYPDHAPEPDAECEAGLTWPDDWIIQFAYPPDFRYDGKAFVHELFHAYLHVTTGDPDHLHSNPAWTDGTLDHARALVADLPAR